MENQFNWEAIRSEFESLKSDPEMIDEEGCIWVELGRVFDIMPSSKYYMPYARSNVTVKEAEEDTEFLEVLEAEANNHGFTVRNGEDDPCDMFAVKLAESN